MIPHQTPCVLPWLFPTLTWRMQTTRNELYLTFDDGPVPGPTEWVLDVLSKAGVPATFFCIGDNVRKYPGIFERVVAGGHAVGNHTVNHLNGWTTATAIYVDNVTAFDRIATEKGWPQSIVLFRPPYGRITRSQIKALGNYRIVMWDVLSQDYNHHLSPEKCLRGTLAACRPGSIIVFHDSYKARKNLEYALPRLLDHFGGKDFQFKQIP
jgi:peptidoglycan-N-acetylglucosamine deacetylase